MSQITEFTRKHKEELDELVQLTRKIKELEKRRAFLKRQLLNRFEEEYIKSIKSGGAIITRINSSNYITLDTKKLKQEEPRIFAKYAIPYYKDSYLRIQLT